MEERGDPVWFLVEAKDFDFLKHPDRFYTASWSVGTGISFLRGKTAGV
jgi:hypothetical protein